VSYGSRCIKFKASQIWNTIPEELKLTTATNQQQNLKLLRKNKNKKKLEGMTKELALSINFPDF